MKSIKFYPKSGKIKGDLKQQIPSNPSSFSQTLYIVTQEERFLFFCFVLFVFWGSDISLGARGSGLRIIWIFMNWRRTETKLSSTIHTFLEGTEKTKDKRKNGRFRMIFEWRTSTEGIWKWVEVDEIKEVVEGVVGHLKMDWGSQTLMSSDNYIKYISLPE